MRTLGICLIALLTSCTTMPPNGFVALYNGKDSAGWTGDTAAHSFSNGVIRCIDGTSGMLLTERQYTNFMLKFEFKLPAAGNNGLVIRYPGTGNAAYSAMCELQILDNSSPKYAELDPRQYHGSAYGMVAANRGHLKPVGEWNSQSVTVVGSTIKVELNGTVILNTDLSSVSEHMHNKLHPGKDRTKGYIGFTGHSSPVEFRNIFIKEL